MFINVTGFNNSGAGAVNDLLREYAETTCVEGEFSIVHYPDGIIDLEYALNKAPSYFNGDVAIQRFKTFCEHSCFPKEYRKKFLQLTEEYIDTISEGKWLGYSSFERTRLSGYAWLYCCLKRALAVTLHKLTGIWLPLFYRDYYLAHNNENFVKQTGEYLSKVIDLLTPDGKIAVLDQFFSAYAPLESMKYLPDAKSIIVNRDPRDLYLLGRSFAYGNDCYPTEVTLFVKYFCYSMEKTNVSSDKILRIAFEDMIYDYEKTINKIENFVGIRNHIMPKKYFNPEISINNTQLKEKYQEYVEDIAYIEKELACYLYLFPYNRKPEGNEF